MYSTHSVGPLFAFVVVVVILLTVLVAVAVYVVDAWFMSLVLKKMGDAPWKAWVPVYSKWVFLEHGGQPGWWALLSLVPIANYAALVLEAIAAYNLGARFAKATVGWVVLYVFVPYVWLAMVAFDDKAYDPSVPFRVAPIAPIGGLSSAI
ncbi:DUF5684 domain-containing protein [Subtercola sp. RTI3]|uniref:DUF5684 domain-containing protein n=1 Tax=Subtercola sp. RTI3 TaxID=3048639 RepID=UPI002B22E021|nr:DUF5684 domain-containing protein [Subtercola sp. RTI3]